jgi:hypothetical protein
LLAEAAEALQEALEEVLADCYTITAYLLFRA